MELQKNHFSTIGYLVEQSPRLPSISWYNRGITSLSNEHQSNNIESNDESIE